MRIDNKIALIAGGSRGLGRSKALQLARNGADGGLVAFLCSEEGRWVNAQRIEASGGMFL